MCWRNENGYKYYENGEKRLISVLASLCFFEQSSAPCRVTLNVPLVRLSLPSHPSQAYEGRGMAISERRITPRFKLHTPLSFHRMEALFEGEQQAKAINISTRGVHKSCPPCR